jgi:hypothetical protein
MRIAMPNKDFAVGAIGAFKETPSQNTGIPGIPNGPPAKIIPFSLVKLLPELGSKKKTYTLFVATEAIKFESNFVQIKGFFSEATEADILVGYRDMSAAMTVTDIVEMWVPWHSIYCIRSLVFRTSSKK